jgi:dihydrofolate reductase
MEDAQLSPVMNETDLSAVVAVASNGTIGKGNTLPWKLRSDLQRFKRLTMGRKTFESIGKALPGRQTIVLSQSGNFQFQGVDVASSVERAIELILPSHRGFVVGGAQVYRLFMSRIRDMYVTEVLAEIEGDASLDPWDTDSFDCIDQSYLPADEFNEWPTCFKHYRRKLSVG